jgi:hypothetical protein
VATAFYRPIVVVKRYGGWPAKSWSAMMRRDVFFWLGFVMVVRELPDNWHMN